MEPAVVVTVIDGTGKCHQLNGWAAALVSAIVVDEALINTISLGQFVADWGPGSLVVDIRRRQRIKIAS